MEEALIEMYLAGVSVRRVEDVSEALWEIRVSVSTISDLNQKAYVHTEEWRQRPLCWRSFLVWLRSRGHDGVKLVVEDKNLGMCEAVNEIFPDVKY